jgi:lipoprotein NlpI
MMRFVFCGFLMITLTGCVTAPQTVWIRIDGQRQTGNPALTQEFEINRLSCLGDRQKADLSGVVSPYVV